MVLLTVLRKQKKREREMRILILGLDNSGKTTILKKVNGEDITTISPTLGTLPHPGGTERCLDLFIMMRSASQSR